MKRGLMVLISLGVLVVAAGVWLGAARQPVTPRFTRADLPPLPAGTNLFEPFMALAKTAPRTDFDHSVLDVKSWAELKERKDNGLNLDFDKAAWSHAEQLDAVLQPTGAFAEVCTPGEVCELIPALYAVRLLEARVLVLANTERLDEALSLVLRLRTALADWERATRTLLAMAMVGALQRDVETLINLLGVDDSPLQARVVGEVVLCDALPVSPHRAPIVWEAVAFSEASAKLVAESGGSWLYDAGESQQLVDRCAELLLNDAKAECPTKGGDALPDWLHNKAGRELARMFIGAMSGVMNRSVNDAAELAALQRGRSWCSN